MEWIPVNTIEQSHFWEVKGSSCETHFRYNKDADSFRFIQEKPLLFFIEKKGLLGQYLSFFTSFNECVGSIYKINVDTLLLNIENQKFRLSLFKDHFIISDHQQYHHSFSIQHSGLISYHEYAAIYFSSALFVHTLKANASPWTHHALQLS